MVHVGVSSRCALATGADTVVRRGQMPRCRELYCTRLRSAMVFALMLVRSSSATGRGRRRAGGGGGPAAAPVQGAPDALDPVGASAVGAADADMLGGGLSALVT